MGESYVRQFYPVEALAKELGKTPEFIHLLRKSGIIKGIKMGKQMVYSANELNKFFEDYAGYELTNLDAMISARALVEKEKANQLKENKRTIKRFA